MKKYIVSLSLATSVLPGRNTEVVSWGREVMLSFVPPKDFILVFESEIESQRIDAVVEEVQCFVMSDEEGPCIIDCRLKNAEDRNAASRAYAILRSSSKWEREE
jgi:hypothetical protein